MSALTIARYTLREARQRRILWVVLALALAYLALFGLGFSALQGELLNDPNDIGILQEINNVFLLVGLYGVNLLTVTIAILLGAGSIAGEIENGTLQTLVAKPIPRWQIVVGKWLGLNLLNLGLVFGLSLAIMAEVWWIGGYRPPHPLEGLTLLYIETLVVLTLATLGGTRLSTILNGATLFALHGLAFLAGWIEQFGAVAGSESTVLASIGVSLLMPSEAMWRRASFIMQSELAREMDVGPFVAFSAPNQAMVFYALIYIVVLLLLALWSFQHRDL